MHSALPENAGVSVNPLAMSRELHTYATTGHRRYSPACHLLASAVIGVSLLLMQDCRAWDYSEHVELTRKAVESACHRLSSDGRFADAPNRAEVQLMCAHDSRGLYARACLAHMVAIAADYLAPPHDDRLGDFRFSGTRWYLGDNFLLAPKASIDCRDINEILHDPDMPIADVNSFPAKLVPSGFSGYFAGAQQAATNNLHFQPDAPAEWSKLAEKMRDPELSDSEVIALFAFSSHYLEDSFAAGHNGLNRNAFRQEFDNAYHDDVNTTGLLVGNDAGEWWYTYGDSHLNDTASFYVSIRDRQGFRFDNLIDSLSQVDRPVSLFTEPKATGSNEGKCETQDLKHFPSAFTSCIQTIGVTQPLILSMPYRDNTSSLSSKAASAPPDRFKWLINALCKLGDCKEKADFVLLPEQTSPNPPTDKDCPDPAFADAHIVIYKCSDSRSHVRVAMNAYAEYFLRRIAAERDLSAADGNLQTVRKSVPTRYRPWAGRIAADSAGNQGAILAKLDGDVSYAQIRDTKEWPAPPELAYGGLQVDHKFSDSDSLDSTAFSVAYGMSLCTRETSCAEPAKGGMFQLRLEVADTNSDFFDGLELSLYSPSRRATCVPSIKFRCIDYLRNVFGFSVKAGAGIDNAWQGSQRNVYGTAGISIDSHFARVPVFIDIDHLWHASAPGDDNTSWRIMIGARLAWLQLGT